MKRLTLVAISAALAIFGVLSFSSLSSAEEGKNIEQMIVEAKTPADHNAIAAFYRDEDVELRKEASQHAELAKKLSSEAGGQAPWASHHYERAEHCRKLSEALDSAAREAQALAGIHAEIARSSSLGKP